MSVPILDCINPDPTGTGLSLNISDVDNSLNLDLALEVAQYFRVENDQAKTIVAEVTKAVSGWPDVAGDIGIARGEQQAMAPAFRVVEQH